MLEQRVMSVELHHAAQIGDDKLQQGTRGAVRKWKTGFYHIALGAGVPMVVGMMDYGRKSGGLGPTIWPTGDMAADMEKVMAIYRDVTPRHPDRATRSMADILGAEGPQG